MAYRRKNVRRVRRRTGGVRKSTARRVKRTTVAYKTKRGRVGKSTSRKRGASRSSGRSSKRAKSTTLGTGTAGQFQARTQSTVTTGRKHTGAQIAKSLGREEIKKAVQSIKWVGALMGGTGQMYASHEWADAGKTNTLYPIYLVDLMNHGFVPGSAKASMYRLNQLVAGTCGWSTYAGTNAAASGNTICPETTYQTPYWPSSGLYPFDKLYMGTTQIKMNLYGARARQVRYKVSLVQFNDSNIAPLNDTGFTNSGVLQHDTFWDSRVKQIVANPICQDYGTTSGKMKVLASRTVVLDPVSSSNVDVDPEVKTIFWNHKMHKMIDYRIADNGQTMTQNQAINAQFEEVRAVQAGISNSTPAVKQRVYLMIEAYSYAPKADLGAVSNLHHPSFDLSIHQTWMTEK